MARQNSTPRILVLENGRATQASWESHGAAGTRFCERSNLKVWEDWAEPWAGPAQCGENRQAAPATQA